jgi:hypothetical protein
VHGRRQRRRVLAQDRPEELGDLFLAEGEHGRVEVEHLALAAQALDGEGRVEPARKDDMQPRRRLAADLLEQAHRRSAPPELVDVVEDDHHIVSQLLLERLAQQRRDRGGTLRLVAVGSERRLHDVVELAADRRYARREGVCDPEHEDGEVRVVRPDRVPQGSDRRRPRTERDGLPVAGVGQYDRQSARERPFELAEEPAAENEFLRRRLCGRELPSSRHEAAARRRRRIVGRRRRIDVEWQEAPLNGPT